MTYNTEQILTSILEFFDHPEWSRKLFGNDSIGQLQRQIIEQYDKLREEKEQLEAENIHYMEME